MQQASQFAPDPIYQAELPARNDLCRRCGKVFSGVACGATRNIGPCYVESYGLSQKLSNMRFIHLSRNRDDQFDGDTQGLPRLHHLNLTARSQKFEHLGEPSQRRNV